MTNPSALWALVSGIFAVLRVSAASTGAAKLHDQAILKSVRNPAQFDPAGGLGGTSARGDRFRIYEILHHFDGGGLNCVIGVRGTGKTTAVELVGYALDALRHRDHAAEERKRIENLVKRNLNGGPIEIGIRATDGTSYRVTRSFGDEPIVLDESGASAAMNLRSGLFRAKIYSQNAVESIADRPLFQLDLIDSLSGQPRKTGTARIVFVNSAALFIALPDRFVQTVLEGVTTCSQPQPC